ncbi:MAG: hypothetical protein ACJ789_01590 [Thermomicrobiales bacterium]
MDLQLMETAGLTPGTRNSVEDGVRHQVETGRETAELMEGQTGNECAELDPR